MLPMDPAEGLKSCSRKKRILTDKMMVSFCHLRNRIDLCSRTVLLEKTLESSLDCKEIQPVHSEDQPWDFFGGNDAEAETPVLWPPHVKS